VTASRPPSPRALLALLVPLLLATVLPVSVSASTPVTISVVSRRTDGGIELAHVRSSRTALAADLRRLDGDPRTITAGVSQERSLVTVVPNDPLLGSQWGWRRLGGPSLRTVGDGGTLVVAVLDTGVDAAHPDLAGRVLAGWDSMNPAGDGRRDPNGHGTHVAGIIAAGVDNAEGIAGVAPGVRILPVRVLDASGNGDDDELALGIIWAVDHGADILNLSIGGAVPSALLEGAIDYALDAGVLVVVAAGNAGASGNVPSYPAAYPQVLAVGATDSADRRAIFSNTGSYLDIAAPGSWIVSTWPGGRYQTSSGTSMAAPFVSAAAALVQARTGLRGRALGVRLVADAVDLGTPGRDDEFGAGLVNPLALIGAVPEPIPVGERSPVIPGMPLLPALPALPEMPALPALPALPAMTPSVPRLPTRPVPEAPRPPDRRAPDRPAHPVRPPTPRDLRREVVLTATSGPGRGGGHLVLVELAGPTPLVVRQRVLVTFASTRRSVLTDWSGRARVAVPASFRGPVRIEVVGSSSTRPVATEILLGPAPVRRSS